MNILHKFLTGKKASRNYFIVAGFSVAALLVFAFYVNLVISMFSNALAPTITTNASSEVSGTQATLTADLEDDGSKRIFEKGFEFGSSVEYGETIKNSQNLDIGYKAEWGSSGVGDGFFGDPAGIAKDTNGYLWVADSLNNTIQKFDTDGNHLATISGPISGDGKLLNPTHITLDSSNNLYIVNKQNERLLKYNSEGQYVASWGGVGDGNTQFRGLQSVAVGIDGVIYTLESQGYQRVKRFSDSGDYLSTWGLGGSENGQFANATDLAIDSGGNVFVIDSGNQRIQKFSAGGNYILSWSSNVDPLQGYFQDAQGISLDSNDNIYVVGATGGIQKFDNSGVWLASYRAVGSGIGEVQSPKSVVVDNNDRVYISDSGNDKILVYESFSKPGAFNHIITALDCGTSYHYRAYAINEDGTSYGDDQSFTTQDCPDTLPRLVTEAASNIGQTTVNLNANVEQFVSNNISSRGFEYGTTTSYGTLVVDSTSPGNEFKANITGLTCNNTYHYRSFATNNIGTAYGDDIQFTSASCNAAPTIQTNVADQLQKNSARLNGEMLSTNFGTVTEQGFEFGTTSSYGKTYNQKTFGGYAYMGNLSNEIGPEAGRLGQGTDIANDSAGNIYVVDYPKNKVVKYSSNGDFILSWGGEGSGEGKFNKPVGIAVAGDGSVYVADLLNSRIQKFDTGGNFITSFGSPGMGDGQFSAPWDVAVDSLGNVYVADRTGPNQIDWYFGANSPCNELCHARIQKFGPSGNYLSQWGSYGENENQFFFPISITIDKSNNVYVADLIYGGQIKKFDTSGMLITKWGNEANEPDKNIDGKFHSINRLTTDSEDNVYVAQPASPYNAGSRIQKFDSNGGVIRSWGEFGFRAPYMYGYSILVDQSDRLYVGGPLRMDVFEPIKASSQFSTLSEDLTCNTQYHYRAYAINQYGTGYGSDRVLTTAECPNAPSVTTGSADIGQYIAALTGTISENGQYRTSVGFEYGFDENYGGSISSPVAQTSLTSSGRFNYYNQNVGGAHSYVLNNISPVATAVSPNDDLYMLGGDSGQGAVLTPPNIKLSNGSFISYEQTNWVAAVDGTDIDFDSNGFVYITNFNDHKVLKLSKLGSSITSWGTETVENGGVAAPISLAVSNDDLIYVNDTNRIVVYNTDGEFIKEWPIQAGEDKEVIIGYGIAVDSNDNVFVSDNLYHRILKFDSNGTFIKQWGGEGVGNGKFFMPRQVSVDKYDNVYVADTGNNRFQMFDNDGNFILKQGKGITDQNPSLFSDNAGSGNGEFNSPWGITTANDPWSESNVKIYVSDTGNNRVTEYTYTPRPSETVDFSRAFYGLNCNTTYHYRAFADSQYGRGYGEDRTLTTAACPPEYNPTVEVTTNSTTDLTNTSGKVNGTITQGIEAVTSRGFTYGIYDSSQYTVSETINRDLVVQGEIQGRGSSVFDNQGNIYFADNYDSKIVKRQSNGTPIISWGSEGTSDGQFSSISSLALDSNNNLYVADSYNVYSTNSYKKVIRIQKFDSNGNFITSWGSSGSAADQFGETTSSIGLAINSENVVHATDSSKGRIMKFDTDGAYLGSIGSLGVGNGQFRDFDSTEGAMLFSHNSLYKIAFNSNDELYAYDTGNGRIQKFSPNGNYLSQFNVSPGAMYIDQNDDLYMLAYNTLRRYNSTGFIEAEFSLPGLSVTGLSFSIDNLIYISDYFDGNVKILDFPQVEDTDFSSLISRVGDYYLTCGETVYYKAFATSVSGYAYGEERSFRTTGCLDIVQTQSATNVYSTSAVMNGRIFTEGSLPSNVIGFQFGPTSSYGQTVTNVSIRNDGYYLSPSYQLTNLDCATTIHFRAFATSDDGTAYGEDRTFTTQSCESPQAVTVGSTAVSATAVTLKGALAPSSPKTEIKGFNYGENSGYGNTVTNTFRSGPKHTKALSNLGTNTDRLATDSFGNIYRASWWDNIIEKFDDEGDKLLEFVADGDNTEGSYITNITVGKNGFIYVVRRYPHQVEVYSSSGNFMTKWGTEGSGNGQFDHIVDIALDNNNFVYVSDETGRVQRFTQYGIFQNTWNDTGYLATDSQNRIFVINPYVDGNVKIYSSNGVLQNSWGSVGTGDGQFLMPSDFDLGGFSIDDQDNVYIADHRNSWDYGDTEMFGRVQIFTATGQLISRVQSPIDNGLLRGVVASSGGNFYTISTSSYGDGYVTDYDAGAVIKYTLDQYPDDFNMSVGDLECNTTYHYQAIATNSNGTGAGDDMQFTTLPCPDTPEVQTNESSSISANQARLNGEVIESSTNITETGFQFGLNFGYGQTVNETVNNVVYNGYITPEDFVGDTNLLYSSKNGSTYYYGSENGLIYKYSPNGDLVSTMAVPNEFDLANIQDLTEDSVGNAYVLFNVNNGIVKYNSSGTYLDTWHPDIYNADSYYQAIVTDSLDNVYVLDGWERRITKLSASGEVLTRFGSFPDWNDLDNDSQLYTPRDLAIDSSNYLYITDELSGNIKIFDTSGKFIGSFGEKGTGEGEFATGANRLAIDEQGNIYATDYTEYPSGSQSNKIVVFDSRHNFIREFVMTDLDPEFNAGGNIATYGDNLLIASDYYDWMSGFSVRTHNFSINSGISNFSSLLNNLNCGDTYHYRAFGVNALGTGYGEDKTVATPSCSPEATLPTVISNDPDVITANGARMNGTVTNTGSSSITQRGFQYGLTTNYGSQFVDQIASTGPFSKILSSLPCNTTYHYRAFAANDTGTAYGENKQFKTTGCQQPPEVAITAPTNNQNFGAKTTEVDLAARAESRTSAIEKVDFYVDGVYIGKSTFPPYNLRVTGLAVGKHTLVVVAHDVLGASSTSEPVDFFVLPPNGSPITPTSGGTVPGTITPGGSTNSPPATVLVRDKVDSGVGRLPRGNDYQLIRIDYKLFPFWFLSLLLLVALTYSIQSLREYRRKQEIIKLLSYYQQLSHNVAVFLGLISHYLNTPLSVMKSALELFDSKKMIATSISESLHGLIDKFALFVEDVQAESRSLLIGNKMKQEQRSQQLNVLSTFKERKVWLPLVCTAIPVAIVDVVATLSGAYKDLQLQFWNQVVLFVLLSIIIITVVHFQRTQKLVTAFKKHVLFEEQTVHKQKIKYLEINAENIRKYYNQLSTASQELKTSEKARLFFNGLSQLDSLQQNLSRAGSFLSLTSQATQVNLANSYSTALGELQSKAKAKNVEVIGKVDDTLAIVAQPEEAEYLFSALLDNAIKFSPQGSAVIVYCNTYRNGARLRVLDSGKGITKEQIAKLYQPFERGTPLETFDYEGMGLGLYSLKILVDKLQGKISITNKPGHQKGVIAEIFLPITRKSIANSQFTRVITPKMHQ